jgi:hypothetical protein
MLLFGLEIILHMIFGNNHNLIILILQYFWLKELEKQQMQQLFQQWVIMKASQLMFMIMDILKDKLFFMVVLLKPGNIGLMKKP